MKLHEAQERGIPKSCIVCGKSYDFPYGRWGDGGSCSRPCELIQEAKPKYGGEHVFTESIGGGERPSPTQAEDGGSGDRRGVA